MFFCLPTSIHLDFASLRRVAPASILVLAAVAGCDRVAEPTQFTPPSVVDLPQNEPTAGRPSAAGRTAPSRNIEMH